MNLITDNPTAIQKSFNEANEFWSSITLDSFRKTIIDNIFSVSTEYIEGITLTDDIREIILSLWIKYVQSGSRQVSLINEKNLIDFSKLHIIQKVYVDGNPNIKT